jgi:hypothetical protein
MTREDEEGRDRPARSEAPGAGSSVEPAPDPNGGGESKAPVAEAARESDAAERTEDVDEGRTARASSPVPAPADRHSAGFEDAAETADDGADLRHLLRGALLREEPETPDVLRGVQQKIRRRSGGKFFSDGWSTERQPPTQTYLVTALVMLAIVIAIWVVLYPISGAPAVVEPPAPVHVIPPQ